MKRESFENTSVFMELKPHTGCRHKEDWRTKRKVLKRDINAACTAKYDSIRKLIANN